MAASEISARINVDVSEALTGLKAIQREAKKATQALRDLEAECAANREIARLATFLLHEYPHEPGSIGSSESAVDVVIRLLSSEVSE